jgi:hypothetical protein
MNILRVIDRSAAGLAGVGETAIIVAVPWPQGAISIPIANGQIRPDAAVMN